MAGLRILPQEFRSVRRTKSDLLVINFVKITMRACGCVAQPLTSIVTARNNANKRERERRIVFVERCFFLAAGNMASDLLGRRLESYRLPTQGSLTAVLLF